MQNVRGYHDNQRKSNWLFPTPPVCHPGCLVDDWGVAFKDGDDVGNAFLSPFLCLGLFSLLFRCRCFLLLCLGYGVAQAAE
jgi:hypothetical protein